MFYCPLVKSPFQAGQINYHNQLEATTVVLCARTAFEFNSKTIVNSYQGILLSIIKRESTRRKGGGGEGGGGRRRRRKRRRKRRKRRRRKRIRTGRSRSRWRWRWRWRWRRK